MFHTIKKLVAMVSLMFLLGVSLLLAQEPQWEIIANSELWNTRVDIGHGGTGRQPPGRLAYGPSYNYPGGIPQNPLWASSVAVIAYEPGTGLGELSPGGSPDYVGPSSVYRKLIDVHKAISHSHRWRYNDEFKEPFITETEWKSNTGITVKLTSYSWSYDYEHTNDLILLKYVFTNTGEVDANLDGTIDASNHALNAFVIGMVYDYDITEDLIPTSVGSYGSNNMDDTSLYPWIDGMPMGISCQADADDPREAGNDCGIFSRIDRYWTGLYLGVADVAVLEGDGSTGIEKKTIWGTPAIGLFRTHTWWAKPEAPNNAEDWFRFAMSTFFESYPGDPGQDQNLAGNSNVFSFAPPGDFTQWVAKEEAKTADPWELGDYAPNPFTGSDRKDMVAPGEDQRFYIGYGPFSLDVGESMTIWTAEVVGVGAEGISAVAERARAIYETYDPTTDEFNIPTPPPAPTIKPEYVHATPNGSIIIEWEDNAEVNRPSHAPGADFAGYRLYRSQVYPPYNPTLPYDPTKPFELGIGGNIIMGDFGIDAVPDSITAPIAEEAAGGFWGPYFPIAEWTVDNPPPKNAQGRYYYEDGHVLIGFRYWYYVAAYDTDGKESFYTMNANGADGEWHGGFPFREQVLRVPGASVTPFVPVANNATDVIVVPNPYIEKAVWDIKAEHTIQFRNIPVPCTIEIYDVTGVFVDRIEVRETAEQLEKFQGITSWGLLNYNHQEVASGLYIYRIKSKTGEKIGKFAIVR